MISVLSANTESIVFVIESYTKQSMRLLDRVVSLTITPVNELGEKGDRLSVVSRQVVL